MDFFLKFDVFPVNSFFQFESNRKVASFPGLFLSIILYIFLLYTFIESDMVQKTNPKISDIIISNTDIKNFEFSNNDFKIEILNDYYPIQYFDPQIWKLEFYIVEYSTGSRTPIPLKNCTSQKDEGLFCLNDSSNISLNNHSLIGIAIRSCVNSSTSSIICKPSEEIFDFVRGISFNLYFKETLFDFNNYDHPIEEKYSTIVVAFLNPNFGEFCYLKIMPIEFTESKNIFYYEDQVPQTYYQQDYKGSINGFYERKGNADNHLNYLLGVQIFLSQDKRVISRKYQGLSEILGQIGGLLSALSKFGALFLSIFPYLKIRKNFFNKLYYIPEKDKIHNDELISNEKNSKLKKVELVSHDLINLSKSERNESAFLKNNNKIEEVEKEKKFENSIFSFQPMMPLSSYLQRDDENYLYNRDINAEKNKMPPLNQLENFENFIQEKKKDNHFLQVIENLKSKIRKNSNAKSVNFSFYNYMKNKLKSLLRMQIDSEGEIILSADKIFEKETDLILLLKRIQDIDKLKLILLNKEQRILFDLIKPTIMTDTTSSREKLSEFSEVMIKSLDIRQTANKQFEEIQNVLRVYEEKINGDAGEMSDIDRNLLEFFKE